MLEFVVSIPPSANTMWRAIGKGHVVLSKKYRQWRDKASWQLATQNNNSTIEGEVRVDYFLPAGLRRDIDNSIKPLNDLLETAFILSDDKQIRQLWIDTEDRDDVRVVVRELPAKRNVQRRAA